MPVETDEPRQAKADDLVVRFHDFLGSTMEVTGFETIHAFGLDTEGHLTMFALLLPPEEAYQAMLTNWSSGKFVELVFGLDRFARPDQGTTLKDLVTGWHFTQREPRPFIVEYQFRPRILRPVEWNNDFWNAALRSELLTSLRRHVSSNMLGSWAA